MSRKQPGWPAVFLIILLLFTELPLPPMADAGEKIKVVLNGKELSFTQEPIIQNGSVMVPFRKILEELGATVEYSVVTHQIEAIYPANGMAVLFVPGNPEATIIRAGGQMQTVQMSQAAIVINGSTLVPLRFISETFGNSVAWDQASRTVTVSGKSTVTVAGPSDAIIQINITKVSRAEGNPTQSESSTLLSGSKSQYDSIAPAGYEYIVVEYTLKMMSNGCKIRGIGSDSILYDKSGKSYETKHCLMKDVSFGTDWRNDWWVADGASCEVDFLVPKGTAPDYMNLQYTYEQGSSSKQTAVLKVPLAGKI